MSDNKSKLKTGVIGVGSMGFHHARVYSEISDFAAISEPNEELGKSVAAKFGVTWYSDYKEMLNQVEAVSIAVPTIYHRSVAEKVSNAGVHFLVEKPLSNNLEDAQAIVEAAAKANVTMAVGHIERHNPVFSSAINLLRNDKANILTLSGQRLSYFPKRITDVGVIFDLTTHDIDLMCYLANSNVHSLYCSGRRIRSSHEDIITLILNFDNGISAVCETNWLSPIKKRQIEIKSNDCVYYLDFINQKLSVAKNQSDNLESLYDVKQKEPLKLELADFLDSIESKREPFVSGENGLKVVKIASAALESMKKDTVLLL